MAMKADDGAIRYRDKLAKEIMLKMIEQGRGIDNMAYSAYRLADEMIEASEKPPISKMIAGMKRVEL